MFKNMRLFIALTLPRLVKEEVLSYQKRIQGTLNDFSPVTFDNLHMTLAFLGETNDVETVKEALRSFSFNGPVSFTLDNTIAFSMRKYDTLVIRANECPLVLILDEKLRKLLDEHNIEYDKRNFVPHVTLGRGVSINLKDLDNFKVLSNIVVSSFSLFESTKDEEGNFIYRKNRRISVRRTT